MMIGRLILNTTHRRTVGDTYPIKATIKIVVDDVAEVVDISGASGTFNFKNSTKSKQTLTGTVTDGPNGKIEFPLTDEQVDTDGTYSYNLKMTIGGKITTFAKGSLILEDDL